VRYRHPCERVLVVEDDLDLLKAIGEFLADVGVEAVLLTDGAAAIAYLASGPLPDVVLLDVALPRASGHEVLEFLRKDPQRRTIPVAAMSGFSRERYAYLPAVDEFLEKPFDVETLNDALSGLCRKKGSQTPAPVA
jgi:CheY-like chemotaxis protein